MSTPYRILMVCLGNICRSPTAQVVMQCLLEKAGLADQITVESAGTHASRLGGLPDQRAVRHAAMRGYPLPSLCAKGVEASHFETWDLILAMDAQNLAQLTQRCPPEYLHKLGLLSAYAVRMKAAAFIPDPYYGGPNGFEHVLDLVEDACTGLMQVCQQRLEHTANNLVLNEGMFEKKGAEL
jgi:protein-tyrosine phosphatase